MSKAFGIIRDVLSAVRRTDLGRSLGAHVVQCKSVQDIQQFEVHSEQEPRFVEV